MNGRSEFMLLETYVNETEGYTFGDSGPIEPYTDHIGDLFRVLRRYYGGCTGYVYIGDGIPVGWVFSRREKYEDSLETYVRTVWVSLVNEFGGYVDLRSVRK